jgi:hypothetical protein
MITLGPQSDFLFLATPLDNRKQRPMRELYEAIHASRLKVIALGTIHTNIIAPNVKETLAYSLSWWLSERSVHHCVFQTSKSYKAIVGFESKTPLEDLAKTLPDLTTELEGNVARLYGCGNIQWDMKARNTLDVLGQTEKVVEYGIPYLKRRSRDFIGKFIADSEE